MQIHTAKTSAKEGLIKLEIGLLNQANSVRNKTIKLLNGGVDVNSCKLQHPAYKSSERGDVPGWVLVVLMTTGLVTAIWTIAAPRLSAILKNSLDAMNGIR